MKKILNEIFAEDIKTLEIHIFEEEHKITKKYNYAERIVSDKTNYWKAS